jgi:shikimate kinase
MSKDRRDLIYLIGFSGTGKSHTGRLLAKKLDWELLDMDELITQKAGAPIPAIFELGEKYFRQIERDVLLEIAGQSKKVISTGGGVPVNEENREVLMSSGYVVRLSASPETIYKRLCRSFRGKSDDSRGIIRPMLQHDDDEAPLDKIQGLLDIREPAYSEAADVTIETDGLNPGQVVEGVLTAWENAAREMA